MAKIKKRKVHKKKTADGTECKDALTQCEGPSTSTSILNYDYSSQENLKSALTGMDKYVLLEEYIDKARDNLTHLLTLLDILLRQTDKSDKNYNVCMANVFEHISKIMLKLCPDDASQMYNLYMCVLNSFFDEVKVALNDDQIKILCQMIENLSIFLYIPGFFTASEYAIFQQCYDMCAALLTNQKQFFPVVLSVLSVVSLMFRGKHKHLKTLIKEDINFWFTVLPVLYSDESEFKKCTPKIFQSFEEFQLKFPDNLMELIVKRINHKDSALTFVRTFMERLDRTFFVASSSIHHEEICSIWSTVAVEMINFMRTGEYLRREPGDDCGISVTYLVLSFPIQHLYANNVEKLMDLMWTSDRFLSMFLESVKETKSVHEVGNYLSKNFLKLCEGVNFTPEQVLMLASILSIICQNILDAPGSEVMPEVKNTFLWSTEYIISLLLHLVKRISVNNHHWTESHSHGSISLARCLTHLFNNAPTRYIIDLVNIVQPYLDEFMNLPSANSDLHLKQEVILFWSSLLEAVGRSFKANKIQSHTIYFFLRKSMCHFDSDISKATWLFCKSQFEYLSPLLQDMTESYQHSKEDIVEKETKYVESNSVDASHSDCGNDSSSQVDAELVNLKHVENEVAAINEIKDNCNQLQVLKDPSQVESADLTRIQNLYVAVQQYRVLQNDETNIQLSTDNQAMETNVNPVSEPPTDTSVEIVLPSVESGSLTPSSLPILDSACNYDELSSLSGDCDKSAEKQESSKVVNETLNSNEVNSVRKSEEIDFSEHIVPDTGICGNVPFLSTTKTERNNGIGESRCESGEADLIKIQNEAKCSVDVPCEAQVSLTRLSSSQLRNCASSARTHVHRKRKYGLTRSREILRLALPDTIGVNNGNTDSTTCINEKTEPPDSLSSANDNTWIKYEIKNESTILDSEFNQSNTILQSVLKYEEPVLNSDTKENQVILKQNQSISSSSNGQQCKENGINDVQSPLFSIPVSAMKNETCFPCSVKKEVLETPYFPDAVLCSDMAESKNILFPTSSEFLHSDTKKTENLLENVECSEYSNATVTVKEENIRENCTDIECNYSDCNKISILQNVKTLSADESAVPVSPDTLQNSECNKCDFSKPENNTLRPAAKTAGSDLKLNQVSSALSVLCNIVSSSLQKSEFQTGADLKQIPHVADAARCDAGGDVAATKPINDRTLLEFPQTVKKSEEIVTDNVLKTCFEKPNIHTETISSPLDVGNTGASTDGNLIKKSFSEVAGVEENKVLSSLRSNTNVKPAKSEGIEVNVVYKSNTQDINANFSVNRSLDSSTLKKEKENSENEIGKVYDNKKLTNSAELSPVTSEETLPEKSASGIPHKESNKENEFNCIETRPEEHSLSDPFKLGMLVANVDVAEVNVHLRDKTANTNNKETDKMKNGIVRRSKLKRKLQTFDSIIDSKKMKIVSNEKVHDYSLAAPDSVKTEIEKNVDENCVLGDAPEHCILKNDILISEVTVESKMQYTERNDLPKQEFSNEGAVLIDSNSDCKTGKCIETVGSKVLYENKPSETKPSMYEHTDKCPTTSNLPKDDPGNCEEVNTLQLPTIAPETLKREYEINSQTNVCSIGPGKPSECVNKETNQRTSVSPPPGTPRTLPLRGKWKKANFKKRSKRILEMVIGDKLDFTENNELDNSMDISDLQEENSNSFEMSLDTSFVCSEDDSSQAKASSDCNNDSAGEECIKTNLIESGTTIETFQDKVKKDFILDSVRNLVDDSPTSVTSLAQSQLVTKSEACHLTPSRKTWRKTSFGIDRSKKILSMIMPSISDSTENNKHVAVCSSQNTKLEFSKISDQSEDVVSDHLKVLINKNGNIFSENKLLDVTTTIPGQIDNKCLGIESESNDKLCDYKGKSDSVSTYVQDNDKTEIGFVAATDTDILKSPAKSQNGSQNNLDRKGSPLKQTSSPVTSSKNSSSNTIFRNKRLGFDRSKKILQMVVGDTNLPVKNKSVTAENDLNVPNSSDGMVKSFYSTVRTKLGACSPDKTCGKVDDKSCHNKFPFLCTENSGVSDNDDCKSSQIVNPCITDNGCKADRVFPNTNHIERDVYLLSPTKNTFKKVSSPRRILLSPMKKKTRFIEPSRKITIKDVPLPVLTEECDCEYYSEQGYEVLLENGSVIGETSDDDCEYFEEEEYTYDPDMEPMPSRLKQATPDNSVKKTVRFATPEAAVKLFTRTLEDQQLIDEARREGRARRRRKLKFNKPESTRDAQTPNVFCEADEDPLGVKEICLGQPENNYEKSSHDSISACDS